MFENKPHYLHQFLYLESKVPDDIIEKLNVVVEEMLNNEKNLIKSNSILAGNIEKEYSLKDKEKLLCPFLYELADDFVDKSDGVYEDQRKLKKWNLRTAWVNYQKKYEHNPIHNHSGVLSFVLWLKVPYDVEKELSLPNSISSNSPSNSLFEFVYTDILGSIATTKIKVDKKYEGEIILFSSKLNHMVYPFYTSDDYRISISGNLDLIDKSHHTNNSNLKIKF